MKELKIISDLYCVECGNKMKPNSYIHRYDQLTGEEVYYHTLKCSSLFSFLHPNYLYDEDGREITNINY